MIYFNKESNNIYVEDDNATTNIQCLDEIEPINKVNEAHISYASFMLICGDFFSIH